MNRNDWKIGMVESVERGVISFFVDAKDISDKIQNGEILKINGIDDFVYAKMTVDSFLLLRITKVKSGVSDNFNNPNNLISMNRLIFFAEPMGLLENGTFISGASILPMVGKNIYGVTDKILNMFFSSVGDDLVRLGNLNNYPSVSPSLNLYKLLTPHIAIVGNSGSGKSTTLRTLLDRLNSVEDRLSEQFNMVVFDVHGDYSHLQFAKHINVTDMHLPLEKLTVDDWSSALLPSELTQRPILNRAISIAKIHGDDKKILYAILCRMALTDTTKESFALIKKTALKWYTKIFEHEKNFDRWKLNFGNEEGSSEIKNQVNKFIYENGINSIDDLLKRNEHATFNISDLENAFELVFSEEEVQGNNKARINAETMIARFRNLKNKYSNDGGIFNENNGTELLLDSMVMSENNKFFVINLTGLDDDLLKLVSNYLVREMFEVNYNSNFEDRKSLPFIYLYLDEAHRYVQSRDDGNTTIFERISREGRKFNVYLGVISQIPSELSSVVMSQTGAYFIHRIQNSIDLEYIRKNVPAASNDLVKRLPVLPSGIALLSGTAFDVPFELKVDDGEYKDISSSLSPLVNKNGG
ncbi:ATP-binding protein [Companilactobacillus sp.]|uniref:ATP-binding protein n=1 Tax=Companilactobacillus sp. TaxID=2767905 RepID=UPI00260B3348|nr:ATP-binding protein [Companilactobacillus sp.]